MMNPATKVRAAVVRSAPVLFDTPRTLDKLGDLTADAARQSAAKRHHRSRQETAAANYHGGAALRFA